MPKRPATEGVPRSSIPNRDVRRTLAEIAKSRGQDESNDLRPHPFAARMPLAVARTLIERLTSPGAVVLDPMGGSGTTLLAAKRLGRVGIGFDIDPLAVVLSRASAMTVDAQALRRAHERVLGRAARRSRGALSRLNEVLGQEEDDFLEYWFPRRAQRELAALAEAIRAEEHQATANLLWVMFSTLIVAKSAGASYALDLAHTRPHRDLDKTIAWPLETWESRFERILSAFVIHVSAQLPGKAAACQGDARHLPLREGSVDLILTSPPYLRSNREAIDYLRAHKFSLVWMGHPLKKLRELRASAMASQRGLYSPDGLPVRIESELIDPIRSPNRQAKVRRYLSDLHAGLREMHRVLRPGGLAVLALGPSIVSRSRRDAPEITRRLGKSVGLVMVASASRRLSDRHRALPPPRLVPGTNSLYKRMRSETFVALRKPSSE